VKQLVTSCLEQSNQPSFNKISIFFLVGMEALYIYICYYQSIRQYKTLKLARSRLWQRRQTQGKQALTSLLAHAISESPWLLSPDTRARAILHHPLFSSSFFRDEGAGPLVSIPKSKRQTWSSSRRTPIRTFFFLRPSSPMSIDSYLLDFEDKWIQPKVRSSKEKRPSQIKRVGKAKGMHWAETNS